MKKVLIISIILLLSAGVLFIIKNQDKTPLLSTNNNNSSWMFDGNIWKVNGSIPTCPDPLVFPAPVDVKLASGILYPGQIRGGDYKPHGGFRFDNRDTNDIEVSAIMDGYLYKASKYLEDGEQQIIIFYINDCGIMVMHDHLLTLSPKLEKALSLIPQNKEGDSRTTNFEQKVLIKKGDVIATEIGLKDYKGQKNIGVDFGLYDLRQTNGVVFDTNFRKRFPMIDEYGTHAVCWLDYLEQSDKRVVKNPLGAVGASGTSSDYCK